MKITIIIYLILLTSCGESKSLTNPNPKEDRPKDFKTVSLEELLLNKRKYHKQYIETEGYYLHSFEISGLYNVIAFPSADTVMEISDYSHSIWIEFDRNQFSLDSVQKK